MMEIVRENLKERLEHAYIKWRDIREHEGAVNVIVYPDISQKLAKTNMLATALIVEDRLLGDLDGLNAFLGRDIIKDVGETIRNVNANEEGLGKVLLSVVYEAVLEKIEREKETYSKYQIYELIENKKLFDARRDVKHDYGKASLHFYINVLLPLAAIDIIKSVEESKYVPFAMDLKMKIKDLPVPFLAMVERNGHGEAGAEYYENMEKYYNDMEKFSRDIANIYLKVREDYGMRFLPASFDEYVNEAFPADVAGELSLMLQHYAKNGFSNKSLGTLFVDMIVISLESAVAAAHDKKDREGIEKDSKMIEPYLEEMRRENYVGPHIVGIVQNLYRELRILKEANSVDYR